MTANKSSGDGGGLIAVVLVILFAVALAAFSGLVEYVAALPLGGN